MFLSLLSFKAKSDIMELIIAGQAEKRQKMKKENLATVLDSLSELYIYIIEQETHRLLYFNQRVKEASPDVKVGACCSELWHENCEDCPLLSMGDQDYSHVIHYNTPFGRVVDIIANKTVWD